MKKIFILIGLLFSGSLSANINDADLEIYDIRQYSREYCDCDSPYREGRICIAAVGWAINGMDPIFLEGQPLTDFTATMSASTFTLTAKTYYMKCHYGETTQVFTDPALQAMFKGHFFYDFIGVKGNKPWLKLSTLDANGKIVLLDTVEGIFADEKLYTNKGESSEFYKMLYPGTVSFIKPLEKILSESRQRMVLQGSDYYKTLKAVLILETKTGKKIGFGDYTIKLRFFLKPGVKPSTIGIEVLKK